MLLAACAALSLTAAPAAVVYAVSDNNIEESFEDVEGSVSYEKSDQQSDLDASSSDLLDSDSDTDSDNSDAFDEKQQSGTAASISGNDLSYAVMPLADYETYYGTIGTTYLEYFRGYLGKMQPDEHYVAARTGQYQYIFAYGAGLAYDGTFYGDDVMVIRFNTQNNGTFEAGIETTFSLDPGSYMVYSDLSYRYPALETSGDVSLRQIVFVAALIIVFYTVTQFMHTGIVKSHSRRWRR